MKLWIPQNAASDEPSKGGDKRKLGWLAGNWTLDERFFEELPPEILRSFSGE
jgi:hypothetical protein